MRGEREMRGNQAGSVVSFVVVGVLLAIGAIGLFYYVGHQMGAPSSGENPGVTEGPAVPDNEGTKEDKESNNNPSNDGQTPSSDEAPAPPVDELSQSGPTETFLTMIILGLLAGTGVSYIRSSRQRVSL